ncbi:hypothetical protein SEA_BRUHMOMENT_46 [Arthrobacter phage BruhMoment]|nr:hypothetical protein SEA_BRUHMOMENT_46 [Arthrobacter phage BruhMoment]
MSQLPAGITTASVHMDAPLSFIGEPGRLHVTVTPSATLVWAATGTPIGAFTDSLSLDPGVELRIDLPHTDQPGFLDGNGNSFTGWYYTVEITYERDGEQEPFPSRDFQILSGQAEVDLALIPSGQAYVPQVAPIQTVTSVNGRAGVVVLAKADVGLGSVDNTSDAAKPVSTATAAALAAKAPLSNPTFTGFVNGLTKAMVGLGNVDNVPDAAKPVSTPQQTALDSKANTVHTHAVADTTGLQGALDGKAPLASPTFTGTVSGISKAMVGLGNVDNTSDALKPLSNAEVAALALKAPLASPTFTGTVNGITKAMVGLGNVDNTADSAKPVSGAQQTALNAKLDTTARGAANGVAALDANSRISPSVLPAYKTTRSLSITAAVGGTLAVTFPAGMFTAVPQVQITKQDANLAKYIPYATGVSATGCTIGIYAGDGTTGTGTASLGVTVHSMD